MEQQEQQIYRTEFDGAFSLRETAWGSYLCKCRDPDANTILSKEDFKKFEVNENATRIPSDLWTAWVKLCFHYVEKVPSDMEVGIRFLRSEEDPTQFIAVVPRQSVTKSSVDSPNFDDCCNLLTGEKYTSYPPDGYIPVGSSHSHNTMNAFFSGVDDSSQLADPGIHLTVGKLNPKTFYYEIAASVVGDKRRFTMHYENLIDATYVKDVSFHENVLEYVDYSKPVWNKFNTGRFSNFQQQKFLPPVKKSNFTSPAEEYARSLTRRQPKRTFDNIDEYMDWAYGPQEEDYSSRDPFYYNENPGRTIPKTETHHLSDLINDFIKENYNDDEVLTELSDSLASILIDLSILKKS
jgi:hypothetical protein